MNKFALLITFCTLAFFGCTGSQGPVQNANVANTSGAAGSAAAPGQTTPSASSTPEKPDSTIVNPDGSKVVRVQFERGATEASYSKSFSGYGYVDFVFDARAGQVLTAELVRSDGNNAILTVLRNETSFSDDAAEVQGWTGDLPENGTYTVRVGQMRNDARQSDKPVNFTIRISIVSEK